LSRGGERWKSIQKKFIVGRGDRANKNERWELGRGRCDGETETKYVGNEKKRHKTLTL